MSETSSIFRKELNETPLFKLQIDENAIQGVFEKIILQVRKQQSEIDFLKKELQNRPQISELEDLKTSVENLKKENNKTQGLVQDNTDVVKSILDERNKGIDDAVQKKVNDMIFSVNAAIHKEMEELFGSCGVQKNPTDEIHKLRLALNKVTQKVDDVKSTIIQSAAAYDGKINIEQLTRKTIPSCVRITANKDRKIINENKIAISRMKNDFDDFSNTFNRVLPYKDTEFPQFETSFIFSKDDTPTFPTAPYVHSFNDFAQYVSTVVPMMQTIIREIHANLKEIEQENNGKLSQKQFTVYKNEQSKIMATVIDEVEDYSKRKSNFVTKDSFNDLSDTLFGIINGAGDSSCTNTRCIACGSIVQRTTGSIHIPKDTTSYSRTTKQSSYGERCATSRSGDRCKSARVERCPSARTTDMLRTDGLAPDHLFIDVSQKSARSQLSKLTPRRI